MQISNIRKNWTQVEQIYFFLLVLIKIYANCLYFVLSKFTFYTIYFFCGLKIEKNQAFVDSRLQTYFCNFSRVFAR